MKIFQLLLLSISLLSCTRFESVGIPKQWIYSELIAIDPADASNPGMDIIAVYNRRSNDEIQIRLDFLDLNDNAAYDLHLALDSIPGGFDEPHLNFQSESIWDDWIIIPASGDIQVLSTSKRIKSNWSIRVFRNTVEDFITISFNRLALLGPYRAPWEKPGFNLQAFTSAPGSEEVVDATNIVSTNDKPPIPVKVLFVFNTILPGYNPSQVLRKWDGAHTGPYGGRHGLFNLLRTARSNRIPLFLLDLKNPSTLSALETFGGIEVVRQMEDDGLLILPLPLPDTRYSPLEVNPRFLNTWIQNIENNAIAFGLEPSPSLFSPELGLISMNFSSFDYQYPAKENISSANDYLIQQSSKNKTFFLPDLGNLTSEQQVDFSGLTIGIRRLLISEAISANHSPIEGSNNIVVLGGHLPASAWGVPQIGRTSFQYIASHPWIKIVDQKTLESLKPVKDQPELFNDHMYQEKSQNQRSPGDNEEGLLTALNNLPDNSVSRAAVDSYNSYFYPVYPFNAELLELRANYTPHLWTLVNAAEWVSNPIERNSCDFDIDHDGETECLLASKNVYAIIEPAGGYLSFLFIKNKENIHQIIGPSSQFTTGTTDPLFWNFEGGIHADPRVIVGAFEDQGTNFQTDTGNKSVLLSSNSSNICKSFRLEDKGITVDYAGLKPGSTHSATIPLAMDPWTFYSNRERYPLIYTKYKGLIEFFLDGGGVLQVKSSENMQVESSLDTKEYFNQTENPNFDYPPGFYLPYPITLIRISAQQDFQTIIRVR